MADAGQQRNQGLLREDVRVLREAWSKESGRAQRVVELKLELLELGIDDIKGTLAIIERDISDIQKALVRIEAWGRFVEKGPKVFGGQA